MNQKMEELLQVGMGATEEELWKSAELSAGYDEQEKQWELIVKYRSSIAGLTEKYPGVHVKELMNRYGVVLAPVHDVDALAREAEIEFMEKPKRLFFQL